MTAPPVNQDVQYDAYGNPIKAKAPDPAKPALALATGNQTAGNTTAYANVIPQAPGGAGNLLGKTIQPGPAVDRVGLAQSAWDKSTQASAPAYEASLQSAKQAAAGVGQLGSGMLRTRLGDLAMQRQQQMDYERSKLMNDAITGSISDQYQNIGIAQQQQGFQAAQQAQDFQQALAAQQAALSTQLGVGQLGVAQQQADTARMGTQGNLALGQGQLGLSQQQLAQQGSQFGQSFGLQQKEQELNRMVATGQLTLAQKDQQLRELQNQQQYGLAGSQLTLAQQAQQNQQKQFNDQLELQRADLTQKYGAQTADRLIEAQKVQNQMQQFQQAQSQQGQQFGLSLAEQQAARREQLGITQQELGLKAQELQQQAQLQGRSLSIQEAQNQAGNMLEQQKMAQQGQQFQQGFGLEQQKAMLDERVRLGQLTLAERDQELERARLAQQGQQFGMTLAEQQAARMQQGQQFGQSQAQDLLQFNRNLELQREDLTKKYGALEADRIIEKQKVENQNKQFGLSLAEQQEQRRQQDAQFGQADLTTQRGQTIAQQGQQQEYLARLAQILGITDIGALKDLLGENFGIAGSTSGTTYNPTAPRPTTPPTTTPPTTTPPTTQPPPEGVSLAPRLPTPTSVAPPSPTQGMTKEQIIEQALGRVPERGFDPATGNFYDGGMGGKIIGNINDPNFDPFKLAAPTLDPTAGSYQGGGPMVTGSGDGSIQSYLTSPNSTALNADAAGKIFGPDGMPMAAPAQMTPEAQQRLAAGWALKYDPNGGVTYLHTPAVNSSTLAINNGTTTATAQDPQFLAYLNQLLGVR